MAFYSIGQLLDLAITRSKTPKALLALKVRNLLPQILKELLPKAAHGQIKNIKATTLKEKTLTIHVPSSTLCAQLKLLEGKIIGQINSSLSGKVVERIRLRLNEASLRRDKVRFRVGR